jgi:hypothetical protein
MGGLLLGAGVPRRRRAVALFPRSRALAVNATGRVGRCGAAGALDAGALDAGALDAGALEAGALEAGALEAGATFVARRDGPARVA